MFQNTNFKSEFGRFALHTKAKPESLEMWINALYGTAPKDTEKKKRR